MTTHHDQGSFSPRRLVEADAETGYTLSTGAGWNQTVSDWQLMINMGQGLGLVDEEDRLIGTSILLPFLPQVDWIGMILVDAQCRRKGIGTRMLRLAIELSPNPIVGLDATEQGRPLYEHLGFVASEGITRYRRPRQPNPDPDSDQRLDSNPASILTISDVEFSDLLLDFVSDADSARLRVLESIETISNGRVCLTHDDQTVALASIRRGRVTAQIGPVYAVDTTSAISLLGSVAAGHAKKAMIVDVPDRQVEFIARLALLGFEPGRCFTRMFKGGRPAPNPCEFAISGPEFG